MDDEEEIDIIGTYDDISSGQILSCDYTVHPNWINENPDGNNFWSDSVPKTENLESNVEVLQSDEVIIEEPAPVPKIIDSEWTEEHITTPDDLVFEEDIPASIEEIVTNQEDEDDEEYDEEEEEEEEIYNENNEESQILYQENEIYNDFEPAAFETHPPDKNTKYIGPTNERSLLKVKIESPILEIFTETDDSKSNHGNNGINIARKEKPCSKFKTKLKVNSDFFRINGKTRINFGSNTISKNKKDDKKKIVKQALQKTKYSQNLKKIMNERKQNNSKAKSSISLSGKGKNAKRKSGISKGNVTISHEAENRVIETGINLGTIVKVDKCDTDSDVEIDVEDISVNDESLIKNNGENFTNFLIGSTEDKLKLNAENSNDIINSKRKTKKLYESLSDELMKQLKDLNTPKQEFHINQDELLEIEKYVNYEFFDGRITKTPEQYFRIRNHILSMWNSTKPNYVSKTAVRSGLKHGGDVNSISRIHRLLEQIGAINFGHEGHYFDYMRPLEDFILMYAQPQTTNRNRTNSNDSNYNSVIGSKRRQSIRNQRFASFSNPEMQLNEANYTIIHTDDVIRPEPPRLNTENIISIYRHIKSEYDLVECLKFSKENIAPFKVSITLSTLLCLQLHSFSSNHEVMGFLGGYCSKAVGRNKISLTRYKPCRTSQQSSTMCEMCPVSQVEQSSSLGAEGYELLGWFHSHPLFPATPSRTDIRTQKDMELQFSIENDKPFIGLILSCINLTLKCIYILPRDLNSNLGDNQLAYELNVDVIKDCTNFRNDVKDVLIALEINNCDTNIREIIDKFKISSYELLNRFGYNAELFYNDIL